MAPNNKSIRTRAISAESKLERRQRLLLEAELLFSSKDFNKVSMDEIAKAAGLAKGTVYLYFDTKEAVFLELVSIKLETWATEMNAALKVAGGDPYRLASAVANTLEEQPMLVRLLAVLHPILEQNIEEQALRLFKHKMLEIIAEPASILEQKLELMQGEGGRLTLWTYAVIVGIAQMTSLSPTLRKVLDEDSELAIFRMDFRLELLRALTAMFKGAKQK